MNVDMNYFFFILEEMRKQSGADLISTTVLENTVTFEFSKNDMVYSQSIDILAIAEKNVDIYAVLRRIQFSALEQLYEGTVH